MTRSIPLYTTTLCIAFALCGRSLSASPADTIMLTDGTPLVACFQGYAEGDFTFRRTDGDTMVKPHSVVGSVQFEPAARVYLKFKGHPNGQLLDLIRYDESMIYISDDGREIRYPIVSVESLELSFASPRMLKALEVARVVSQGEAIDLPGELRPHKAAVVLFHSSSSSHSTRLDAYISRLARMARKLYDVELDYLRIDIADVHDAPVMGQHHVADVPEVWVYDRQGQLQTKLDRQISPRHIDAAVEAATYEPKIQAAHP